MERFRIRSRSETAVRPASTWCGASTAWPTGDILGGPPRQTRHQSLVMQYLDIQPLQSRSFRNLTGAQVFTQAIMSSKPEGIMKAAPDTTAGAEELFDSWADSYDSALLSWKYLAPKRVADIAFAEFGTNKGGNLLDLGCGTGLGGQAARVVGFAGKLVGVDISQASINYVRNRKPDTYHELHYGNLNMPMTFLMRDNVFHAVISIGVFRYVEKFDVLFKEIHRVAAKRAIIIFTHLAASWDSDVRQCRSAAQEMEKMGLWSLVRVGEPEEYMPNNPDEELAQETIRYVVYRKR